MRGMWSSPVVESRLITLHLTEPARGPVASLRRRRVGVQLRVCVFFFSVGGLGLAGVGSHSPCARERGGAPLPWPLPRNVSALASSSTSSYAFGVGSEGACAGMRQSMFFYQAKLYYPNCSSLSVSPDETRCL